MDAIEGKMELDPFSINPIGKLKATHVFLNKLVFQESKELSFVHLCFVKGETPEPVPDYIAFGRRAEHIAPILFNELKFAIDLSEYKSCYLAQNLGGKVGEGINPSEKRVTLYFSIPS